MCRYRDSIRRATSYRIHVTGSNRPEPDVRPAGQPTRNIRAILPMLSERYCTINLTGANVGFVSVLEARGRSGYLRVVRSVLDEVSLHPGDSILEVGCGSGVLSRWLAHRTHHANPIVALDLNDYLLREARALAAKEGLSKAISFRNGNAERLPFPDDSFSVTLAFTVLEEGHADRMLAEMVRVTKPGGYVAVIVRSVDMGWTVNLDLPPTLKAKVEAPIGSVASDSNVPFYVQKRLLNKAWAVMVRG